VEYCLNGQTIAAFSHSPTRVMTLDVSRSACGCYLDIKLTSKSTSNEVFDRLDELTLNGGMPHGFFDVFAIKLTGGSAEQQSELIGYLGDSVVYGALQRYKALAVYQEDLDHKTTFVIARVGKANAFSAGQVIFLGTRTH
jgi:hypothetical protein